MEPKKILIVDDEEQIRTLLGKFFAPDKFKIIYASDGFEGLEKAKAESPDLIIIDIMLPGLSGFSVCKYLKSDVRFKHIKVIILSGRDTQESKSLGMEAGADLYLIKPVTRNDLLANVYRILEI